MDWRVCLLTKRQRFALALIFTVLCVVQISFGALTTAWSVYICLSVAPRIYTEKTEIIYVFTTTGIFGTHIVIHYLVGIKICEKCVYKAHKKSTRRILLFWCMAGCNLILNIIILAVASSKVSNHITKSMRHSMERGMQSYLTAPIWKHMIDKWQFTFQCCGVNDYKDWHDLTWLDHFHIDISAPVVKEMRLAQDRFHFPVTPWSCCRSDFPMQCLHDPFQQVQSAHLWKEQPKLVLESINTDGCLDRLGAPIQWSLIFFTLICTALVLFQAVIIIVARLLYTSNKNAIILRDPEGDAPGYVFTRKCSGQPHKTVSELVLDLKLKKKQPEPSARATPKKKSAGKKTNGKLKKNKSGSRSDRKSPNAKKNAKSPARNNKKTPVKRKQVYDSMEDAVSTEDEEALMLR